jgi:hypothetical protein
LLFGTEGLFCPKFEKLEAVFLKLPSRQSRLSALTAVQKKITGK